MILKLIAVIASFFMLFTSNNIPLKDSAILTESPPDGKYDEITGAAGSVFYIKRPSQAERTIYAEDFGLSVDSLDNFTAFQNALDFCKANPNSKLIIKNGIYRFASEQALFINGCDNLFIDGQGATFVFSSPGYKFIISDSSCVEIANLNIDWAWDEKPLASVVTISESNPSQNTLNFVFKDAEYCDVNNAVMVLTQCDKESFTFGEKGIAKEIYLSNLPDVIKSYEKINNNTIKVVHDGALNIFKNGEAYILRHYSYGGTIFCLNNYANNITFDNVNIFGGPGMGYVCEGNSSHFQIINSSVVIPDEYKDKRCISLASDAIHIANTNGCFNISDCDISAMGDDAVNVHDGLGYVNSVKNNVLSLTASAMRLQTGDVLGFKDKGFNDTSVTAKILSVRETEGITKEITAEILNGEIKPGFVAYNTACNSANYVIKNNYIHEHRARGLLLQSSNGLVENNHFYKTQAQAIKIVMDIQPTLWQEGTGCDNIVIRNNKFDSCNYSNWGNVIEIGTNIDGQKANGYVFSNVEISNNSFVNIPSLLIKAENINGLTIENNSVDIGNIFDKNDQQARIALEESCANISYKNNHFSKWTSAVVKSKSIGVWAQANSKLFNMTFFDKNHFC